MNLHPILTMTLLGSLLILDKYAFGEFGISMPLVAGLIIGAIYGDIRQGVFLGGIFQLIFLGGLPIGRDIPPDSQGAGIVACGSYFLMRPGNTLEGAIFLAAFFGLVAGIVGGALEILVRRYNEKLYYQFMRRENRLALYHFLGLATAFFRGVVLFLPFFLLAGIITYPAVFSAYTKDLLAIVGVSMGLANAIYLFAKRRTVVYVLIGGLCALALFVL
jgi:mannose/fructose/N-acetylgalactosamine-specific phosphotransferase system component IIC